MPKRYRARAGKVRTGKALFIYELIRTKFLPYVYTNRLMVFSFRYLPMAGIIVAFQNFNYREGLIPKEQSGLNNFHFFKSGKFGT